MINVIIAFTLSFFTTLQTPTPPPSEPGVQSTEASTVIIDDDIMGV